MNCDPRLLVNKFNACTQDVKPHCLHQMSITQLADLHDALGILAAVTAGLIGQPRFKSGASGRFLDDLCDDLNVKSELIVEHLKHRYPATEKCHHRKILTLIDDAVMCRDPLSEIEALAKSERPNA